MATKIQLFFFTFTKKNLEFFDDGGKIELLGDRKQQVRSKSLKKSLHGLKSLKSLKS